jgi:hypothetical protein
MEDSNVISMLKKLCKKPSVDSHTIAEESFSLVIDNITLFSKTSIVRKVKADHNYDVPWIVNDQFSHCMRCKEDFGPLLWRHHCRMCGYLVCNACSQDRVPLDKLKDLNPVRFCTSCFKIHHMKSNRSKRRTDEETPEEEPEPLLTRIPSWVSGSSDRASGLSKPEPPRRISEIKRDSTSNDSGVVVANADEEREEDASSSDKQHSAASSVPAAVGSPISSPEMEVPVKQSDDIKKTELPSSHAQKTDDEDSSSSSNIDATAGSSAAAAVSGDTSSNNVAEIVSKETDAIATVVAPTSTATANEEPSAEDDAAVTVRAAAETSSSSSSAPSSLLSPQSVKKYVADTAAAPSVAVAAAVEDAAAVDDDATQVSSQAAVEGESKKAGGGKKNKKNKNKK